MRILIPPLSANVPIPMSTFGDPVCFSTFSVRTEINQIENINTKSAPAGTEDLANLYSKVDKTTSPEYFTTTKCSPLRFRFAFDRLTDFLCRDRMSKCCGGHGSARAALDRMFKCRGAHGWARGASEKHMLMPLTQKISQPIKSARLSQLMKQLG